MPITPFFPSLRSRLAALGRRNARAVRQCTLQQLQENLARFLPPQIFSAEEEGPNSRERIFSVRLTLECFLWQMLKPRTSCREVVRQVQALFSLHGHGSVDEGDSAYVQARQRLPRERLEKALAASADTAEELIQLYSRRWRLELCFRDLKTTMGMEQLRCKSPDLAEKELLAYLVDHNLVRCLMAEAAGTYQVALERLSFKGSVDAFRQYSAAIAQARSRAARRRLWDELIRTLARDLVRDRPGREGPRAVKRRPKPYPLLNKPRSCYKTASHRNRYWKSNPRNK